MEQITVQDINTESFNPFDASAEELLVCALDDSGLLKESTIVNNIDANLLKKSYFEKREAYKNSTKVGNLLVKANVITSIQLQKALDYHHQNPGMKIGDAIVALNFCTHEEIEKCLDSQAQIRYDIRELDDFINKINQIKDRLVKYLC